MQTIQRAVDEAQPASAGEAAELRAAVAKAAALRLDSDAATPRPAPRGDATSRFVSAMLRFSRLARSWEALEGAGMSKVQVAILIELAQTGTERVTSLAKRLGIEISVISRQLTAMSENGTVERVRDPEDGRAWLVTLSDKGRQLLSELHDRRYAWFSRILTDFGDDEREIAARVIEAVNAEWESVQRRHFRQSQPRDEQADDRPAGSGG